MKEVDWQTGLINLPVEKRTIDKNLATISN